MVGLIWRPSNQAALPRVSLVRCWLYRIATAVAASFVAVAVMAPTLYSTCGRALSMVVRIPNHLYHLHCDPPWSTPMRIEVALTGVLVGLLIAFIGARIDHLIVRSRLSRGGALLPSQ